MPAPHAAVLGRLRRPRILLHLLRERVPRIPVLLHARVRHPPQNRRDRRRQVGQQDRLPHREDADLCRGIRAQHVLNCGGPPQTRRSRRGEQEDDARPVGVALKSARSVSRLAAFRVAERRLARRHSPRAVEVPEHRRGERGAPRTTGMAKRRFMASRRRRSRRAAAGRAPTSRRSPPTRTARRRRTLDDVEHARRARRSWRPPMASSTTDAPRNQRLVVDHEQPDARRCRRRRESCPADSTAWSTGPSPRRRRA